MDRDQQTGRDEGRSTPFSRVKGTAPSDQVQILVRLGRQLARLHNLRRQPETKRTSSEDPMQIRGIRIEGPGETQCHALVIDIDAFRGGVRRVSERLFKEVEKLLITRKFVALEGHLLPCPGRLDDIMHHEVDEEEERQLHLEKLLTELGLLTTVQPHPIQQGGQRQAGGDRIDQLPAGSITSPGHDLAKDRTAEFHKTRFSHWFCPSYR